MFFTGQPSKSLSEIISNHPKSINPTVFFGWHRPLRQDTIRPPRTQRAAGVSASDAPCDIRISAQGRNPICALVKR